MKRIVTAKPSKDTLERVRRMEMIDQEEVEKRATNRQREGAVEADRFCENNKVTPAERKMMLKVLSEGKATTLTEALGMVRR